MVKSPEEARRKVAKMVTVCRDSFMERGTYLVPSDDEEVYMEINNVRFFRELPRPLRRATLLQNNAPAKKLDQCSAITTILERCGTSTRGDPEYKRIDRMLAICDWDNNPYSDTEWREALVDKIKLALEVFYAAHYFSIGWIMFGYAHLVRNLLFPVLMRDRYVQSVQSAMWQCHHQSWPTYPPTPNQSMWTISKIEPTFLFVDPKSVGPQWARLYKDCKDMTEKLEEILTGAPFNLGTGAGILIKILTEEAEAIQVKKIVANGAPISTTG